MSAASPYFLRVNNIIQYISVYGITAIGMTMVILTGGINLSVGGTLALSAWFAAKAMLLGLPWPVAILTALVIGAFIGLINGFAISTVGIPPLIATLALEQVARGLQMVLSRGLPLHGFPESFVYFGAGRIMKNVPMSVIWTLALFILFSFFLGITRLGRTIYAVGGNPNATRIAGINNRKIIIFVYVLAGILASFAGLILIARMDSAPVAIALNLDMQAITCVIGGASVTCGGKGRLFGTFLGIIIMGLIQNSLDLLNVSPYYQQFFQGIVIFMAVTLDALRNVQVGSVKQLFHSLHSSIQKNKG